MLRFFISPHPTFKSYKAPDRERAEKSPYFWWWYALTLNTEYVRLCEQNADDILLTDIPTENEQKMRRVHEDFGDVRYEGDRYKAFCDWWRTPVSTGERRGEFLFAEPVHTSTVSVLESVTDAERTIASADTLVLSIPLNRQRQHVDKAIDKLLKKHMRTEKGRAVRNPRQSRARYHLNKAAVPSALKKSFDLYDAKRLSKEKNEKISNFDLAKSIDLAYLKQKTLDDSVLDEAAKRRIISVQVTRYITQAEKIISKVLYGEFN
ncbi:hypothetical protein SAMN04487869_11880 [Marinobacter sp. DSM 26671]|uniref:hypothetical protein n=1 Tax=Marinobacter sp. DSM 26671 TaxID=1761793 RepID=UPI0008EDD3D0|nr:hypothetical protein [Marinobacter sp. DSM 26671]SFE81188.1 hypothetical protein SAMN04487869_11880 [Marinobacter sp. DSM 26671]